jgi:zinc protease
MNSLPVPGKRSLGPVRAVAFSLAFALVAMACSDGGDSLGRAIERVEGSEGSTTTTDPDAGVPNGDDPDAATDPEPDPTPLPVDPDLRMGTLDNGLTYYLRSNDSPGSNLDLRLVIDAGSLQEPAPGRGSAHFLEHMLFNGTELFPGNELDGVLRSLGAEIGPDFNAYTSYDETVYFLTVSTFDDEAVETAFDVVAQWADAATIDADAVVAERGVVREELRERVETGEGFIVTEFDKMYTLDSAYRGFDPIGTVESIESMESAELREFYDSWYRPENMAVVAVGDMPLDDLEALIVDRFSDLEGRGSAPARIEALVSPPTGPTTQVFTHPDQGTAYLSLDFQIPVWDEGTVGGEKLALMEGVIVEMLGNRLTDAHTRGRLAQDTAPHLELFSYARELRYLGTNLQADDLATALTAYMSVLLTAEANGFTDEDLARATETFEAGFDFLLESAGSTQDAEFADRYMTHFLQGADLGSIRSTVRRNRELIGSLTATDLTDHFRWMMQQAPPIVAVVGPDEAALPTTTELDAALAAATVGDQVDGGDVIDELMARPEGVEATEVNTILDIGGAEWIFDNGARVLFVESEIAEGAVDLWASGSGGWSLLDPGDAAIAPLVTTAVTLSGLGEHDRTTLDRFLAGSTAWIEPYIDQTDEGFFGGSSRDDLVTLFQLLHLAITEPRVDDFALTQALTDGENSIATAETEPQFQQWVELNEALYGSDPWQVFVPTQEQLDGLTAEAALAMYEARLGDVDDLVVAVVGDVTIQVVELMAERYVGTLPAGPPDTYVDVLPAAPEGVVSRTITLDDDVTAAGMVLYHEASIDVTPAVEVAALVLQNIINSRLFLSIREDLGASYGGTVFITPFTTPDEVLESVIDVSGDPERLDLIRDTILRALDDLATTGPSADEFAQAVSVVGNDMGFIDNFTLLHQLLRYAAGEGDDVPWSPVMFEELDRLGPEDVRALAAVLYPSDRRVEVIRTP